MSQSAKKVIAVVILAITIFAWIITIFGIGPVKPLKDQLQLGLDIKGGVYVVLEAQTDQKGEELKTLMDQTQAVIENRVYEMGFSDPTVTIEGENRIRVEIPGVEDANKAIETIGQVAQLQFVLADGSLVVDGSEVKDASFGQSQSSVGYAVNVQFNSSGADKFAEGTKKALEGTVTPTISDENGEQVEANQIAIVLDGTIISHPRVNEVISGGSCEITGNFSQEEASNLAALIRGGSLPVELKEITSSTQTATIGMNALEKSVIAGFIGLALVCLIMLIGYRMLGLAADLALMLYVLIILWTMALTHSTLTLPGIAGIILGVGMAVDANVIIFARIREELTHGLTIRSAKDAGFSQGFRAVFDSQVTTLIASVVLYEIGTSTVKSFATTLMIGILASILCAVVVTNVYLTFITNREDREHLGRYGIKKNGVPTLQIGKQFNFVKHRKIYYIVTVCLIVIGLGIGAIRGFNMGIDFTGGTMMQIDFHKHVTEEEIDKVLDSMDIDIAKPDVIYAGDNNEQAIIRTTTFLDNDDREKVVEAFAAEYDISDEDVLASEQFGGSVGKELRTNALKSVLIAAIGMLIYIIFRFRRAAFGFASIAALIHDVLFVLAFYGLFHVTINNPFIAGILTLVGYSINDTIVVFDRIRENFGYNRAKDLDKTIDLSVNQTLSRSMMTSITTLLCMVPMYVLVSSSIREFVLPLMVGVIVGCLSSILIASPVYYDLDRFFKKRRKTQKKPYEGTKKEPEPKKYSDGAVV